MSFVNTPNVSILAMTTTALVLLCVYLNDGFLALRSLRPPEDISAIEENIALKTVQLGLADADLQAKCAFNNEIGICYYLVAMQVFLSDIHFVSLMLRVELTKTQPLAAIIQRSILKALAFSKTSLDKEIKEIIKLYDFRECIKLEEGANPSVIITALLKCLISELGFLNVKGSPSQFRVKKETYTTCMCGKVYQEIYNSVMINVAFKADITDSMRKFLNGDILHYSTTGQCRICGSATAIQETYNKLVLPRVIVLRNSRLDDYGKTKTALQGFCKLDESIYVEKEHKFYDLRCVINFISQRKTNHVNAYRKIKNDWYLFDDNVCREVRKDAEFFRNAWIYVLIERD